MSINNQVSGPDNGLLTHQRVIVEIFLFCLKMNQNCKMSTAEITFKASDSAKTFSTVNSISNHEDDNLELALIETNNYSFIQCSLF